MNQTERRERLIRAVSERRTLSIRRGMELTQVSEPTIRRDFAALAAEGAVQRAWGGIGLPDTDTMSPFAFREVQYSEEKAALARKAASLLNKGDVVFIDGGTTTYHLASCLADIPLRIVTNSLRLAEALQARHDREAQQDVYLTGGLVYANGGLLIGAGVADGLRQYHANWAFISVSGVTEAGLYNTSELVVQAEREMICNADRVVVLVDHSKIGKHAMFRIGDVDEIDMLVTDIDPAKSPILSYIVKRGVQILTV